MLLHVPLGIPARFIADLLPLRRGPIAVSAERWLWAAHCKAQWWKDAWVQAASIDGFAKGFPLQATFAESSRDNACYLVTTCTTDTAADNYATVPPSIDVEATDAGSTFESYGNTEDSRSSWIAHGASHFSLHDTGSYGAFGISCAKDWDEGREHH